MSLRMRSVIRPRLRNGVRQMASGSSIQPLLLRLTIPAPTIAYDQKLTVAALTLTCSLPAPAIDIPLEAGDWETQDDFWENQTTNWDLWG